MSSTLVERYVKELTEWTEPGTREWVHYRRIPEAELDETMAAIVQAAGQMHLDLHINLVPAEQKTAPVASLPGTAVIRMGNFAPLWAADEVST